MKEVGGFHVTELTGISLLGEDKVNGENCYVLRGYHPFKFPVDLWISKKDFLIRKTREPGVDGSYKVEVRKDVKLNVTTSREIFNFKEPPYKPRLHPQLIAKLFMTGSHRIYSTEGRREGRIIHRINPQPTTYDYDRITERRE